MKKEKSFLILSVVMLLIIFIRISFKYLTKEKAYSSILYSWNLDNILNDMEKFHSVLNDYNINIIYQDFTSNYLKEENDDFQKEMKQKGIKVYHLAGDPSWGKLGGEEAIKEEIKKVSTYNKKVTNKLSGLVLDIEPYISEKEEEFAVEDFNIYVDIIKEGYQYAKENDVELILAIPYWFDKIDESLLEELIIHSDGISVMNYIIDKTKKNISVELKYAKKHAKKIDTIYEIEYSKDGYFSSYKEVMKDYENIKKDDANELGISFHHYASIIK